jgi:hypothetical protein
LFVKYETDLNIHSSLSVIFTLGGQYTHSDISLEMVSFGAHVVNTFETVYMAILKR